MTGFLTERQKEILDYIHGFREQNGFAPTHREICLRVNLKNPIKSNLVRQAMALTLDRPSIVKKLFNGYADVGNDSPFAPVYPSTNKKVPQRHKDIAKAKQLMSQAGYPKGFSIKLTTEKVGEIPQLAQIFQSGVKQLGINMSLEILTSFGDGGRQPGQFFAVHSIATDSKGNIYTTETYEGKRVQKFTLKDDDKDDKDDHDRDKDDHGRR